MEKLKPGQRVPPNKHVFGGTDDSQQLRSTQERQRSGSSFVLFCTDFTKYLRTRPQSQDLNAREQTRLLTNFQSDAMMTNVLFMVLRLLAQFRKVENAIRVDLSVSTESMQYWPSFLLLLVTGKAELRCQLLKWAHACHLWPLSPRSMWGRDTTTNYQGAWQSRRRPWVQLREPF